MKVWNAATGEEIRTLPGHSSDVISAVFSPDGQLVASGSDDKTVKIWDATTGEEIRTRERAQRICQKRRLQPRRQADRFRQLGQNRENLERRHRRGNPHS
ncbi:MAG: hypothetical protein MUC60_01585 [Oscillatoria sp. Prado101]|nr:hypothetical protein [Oscillatoria sp. Prado101]